MSTAERLRVAVASTEVAASEAAPIHFTISIGVAVPEGDSPAELLRRSDDALYAAKMAGRNTVMLAPRSTSISGTPPKANHLEPVPKTPPKNY
jgi:diguanylate cyclase (GGDEF)-like protein